MDGTNAKVIEKIMEKKTDWTKRIDKIVETGLISEKEKVIIRLEKVVNFLKGAPIDDEEDLAHLNKPVDDLEACLKYIPNGPFFNDVIPTELKDVILSYLCESNAFTVASVCQEWKKILEKRFNEKKVMIGEECIKCEGGGHVQATDMLKAATIHKLDVHLSISKPIGEVDSSLITDALTSVSKFTVVKNRLSDDQLQHLFESIERGDKIMEEVRLVHLDLRGHNKERLANCLFNKIKKLTLYEDDNAAVTLLDAETFIKNLLQNANLKLTQLTIDFLFFFDGLPSQNVADALCNVENLKLCDLITSTEEVMEKLIKNILEKPIVMKTLIIVPFHVHIEDIDKLMEDEFYDFGLLVSPLDLKVLFKKMDNLHLDGLFTLEQLKAVRSIPDVEVSHVNSSNGTSFHSIKKGSDEMF